MHLQDGVRLQAGVPHGRHAIHEAKEDGHHCCECSWPLSVSGSMQLLSSFPSRRRVGDLGQPWNGMGPVYS